ncbi:MinD/ParA family ATP-binding protein [Nocardia brasiliensis]|uniref:MinD/ParA family ATP-binding protein n=1 Tax=Nocardia brasiliensis TaxID=37326 RepID=UPI0024578E95|nr:MinD/ParA family protein [Nocardia brasiliensis]
MTTNDHNPTSPPWLQSQAVDTADATESEKSAEQSPEQTGDVEVPAAEAETPDQPEQDPAQPDFSGSTDQTVSYPQASAPQQPYGPPDGFSPPGPAEQYGGYAPPNAGPFAPPGPYEPYQTGPYQPVAGHSGSHQVAEAPNPGYGEYRQEIGPDGLVRRVPEQPEAPAPQPEPQAAPIYSWAPPPPPVSHQPPPVYQQQPPPPQPMGQQPAPSWQGGPNPHQPAQPFQPQHVPAPGQPGHSVNDLNLLKRARRAPRSGWRRAVHKATGGMLNPGESAADVVYRDLVDRVNQPVRGDYRIAILSLKGGVGKTTTTVGLGSTFASLRGDRVIAIDANPDLGTLAHRVPRQTRSTVRNLLEDQHISRYSDVRAHTSQAPSRLEVLASEQDPAVSEAFSEADYRKAIGILQSFYNIILTDCGTGLMHSAMAGVLDMASSLVLVTSPAIDGARSASATLDWLDHHGYGKLVERTVVVVNASRRGASTVDLDQLRKLFLDRTRAVQVVPFDDHLAEGAEIDLELVSKPTRRALLELAAMVADDFGYVGAQQYHHPGPMGD